MWGNPYRLLLSGFHSQIWIIARQYDLQEVLIIQNTLECAIKELDDKVDVKFRDSPNLVALYQEIKDIGAGYESGASSINPREARVRIKGGKSSEQLSLVLYLFFLVRD